VKSSASVMILRPANISTRLASIRQQESSNQKELLGNYKLFARNQNKIQAQQKLA